MKNANFVAIDFETATKSRFACQLGIIIVNSGLIKDRLSFLIQPPLNKYDDDLIDIHHITPDITANAPTFDIVWKEIKQYFDCNFIVGHNVGFDINVLYKNLDFYNIERPVLMGTSCTYELTSLPLDEACEIYNIPLPNHHDGTCDAEACALLFLKYLNRELNIPYQNQKYSPSKHINSTQHKILLEGYSQNDPLGQLTDDSINSLGAIPDFQGKRFLITGATIFNRDKAYSIIKALGGKKSSTINKSLNYVIVGVEAGPKKMEIINHLNQNGCSIEIISDSSFIDILRKHKILK